jgi:hypothetical protein
MSSAVAWRNRVKAIVLGLGLGLALLTSANWLNIFIDHVPQCSQPNCVADFAAIYSGAKLMWENPRSLYDPSEQLAHQQKIAPTERALPFVYPPITAVILSPLAWLPFSAAFLAMTFINILLLSESLRLLIRYLNLTKDQSHWLLLYALCSFGVHAVVFYGQTSVIVLFVLSRHLVTQKIRQEIQTGLWAGLLCVKPQFLPIPYLVLSIRRSWRAITTAGLVALLLLGGTFFWIGLEATKQYILVIGNMTAENSWTHPLQSMHNLKALASTWLPARWQASGWGLGSAIVIFIVVRSNLRARAPSNDFAVRWIINILALLLLLPHLFTHDLALLIIPCALLLSLFKECVPIPIGIGLAALAALPALNHLCPTIVAITLTILLALSLMLDPVDSMVKYLRKLVRP